MSCEQQSTQRAFLWTNVLKAPFWALYNLLVFILYKDLHATGLQVALFLALKPTVSILSIYWSQFVANRRDRLIPNIATAGILGYLPFLFSPFVHNAWYFIFSGALYMMLTRGVVPAWMEILKINLPENAREKVFSYGSAISYVGGIAFPLLLGGVLDTCFENWKWLFSATAFIGLGSLFFQLRIPVLPQENPSSEPIALDKKGVQGFKNGCRKFLFQPWKIAWNLFREREDFRQYQLGFFLGGVGLVLMQPALPHFFFDTLNVSYTELAVALSVCKGIGFALTTRFWTALFAKIPIFAFSAVVTLLAAFFPLSLLLADHHIYWLYFSYLSYGVMQAGSELSWHLSGPVFARNEDSSSFSSANVALVGLRGCIIPFLGSLLCSQYSASFVLVIAASFCLFASLQMYRCSNRFVRQTP